MSDLERLATWIVDNQDKKGTPEFSTVEAGFRELYASQPAPSAPAPIPSLVTPPTPSTNRPLPDARERSFTRKRLILLFN